MSALPILQHHLPLLLPRRIRLYLNPFALPLRRRFAFPIAARSSFSTSSSTVSRDDTDEITNPPGAEEAQQQQLIDVNPPKGTRDFPPEDMRLRNWLFQQFREVSRILSFEEVDFPVLESEALFIRKAGEEITQQLYNFEDKGGRRVVLRPELTPSLARLIIKQGKSLSLPLKWFTIGQCWRYERMTRGRRREHYQWNMDIFGVSKVRAEAELIYAIVLLFERLGITSSDVGIRVSSRKRLLNYKFSITMSSPDTYSVRSGATSPTDPNQEAADSELQDIAMAADSSTWAESYGNKETGWVDNKKNEVLVINDDDAPRDWDGDSLNGLDSPSQGSVPDVRVFADNHRRTNSITTDNSNLDFDFASSDYSEQDMHSHPGHPKSDNSVNGGLKVKRAQPGTRNIDTKTPNRGNHTPSPSRKLANTPSPGQMANRSTKPVASAGFDGKRRQNGKVAGAK